MEDNNTIILFGCGKIGSEALAFFESENVASFCDNNQALKGTEKCGKIVISFDDLREKYHDSIVIICVLSDLVACEIAKQCEENGISDYLFFTSIKKLFLKSEHALAYIANPINRMQMRKEFYLSRTKSLQAQVNFFKKHADIRHIKPATGELRERQMNLIRISSDFLNKISKLDIKPFLYGGNLLGYIRHNGFIPWDDDIDFALIRDEFDRLKEYCKLHIYTEEEFFDKNGKVKDEKEIADDTQDYFYCESNYYLQIIYNDAIAMDFFPFDYYADDYSFDEFTKFAEKVDEQLKLMESVGDRIKCVEAAKIENRRNIVKESGHIYSGIDNSEAFHKYRKGWIPQEIVFPLQRVLFEGEYFWVPNDPEEFITYEFENVWEFPDDVGIPRHCTELVGC